MRKGLFSYSRFTAPSPPPPGTRSANFARHNTPREDFARVATSRGAKKKTDEREHMCARACMSRMRWSAKWPVYNEKTRERFVVYAGGDPRTPLCAPLFLSNGGWVMLRIPFFFLSSRSCRAFPTGRVTSFFLFLLVDVCPPPTYPLPPVAAVCKPVIPVRPPSPTASPFGPRRNFDYNPAQLLSRGKSLVWVP